MRTESRLQLWLRAGGALLLGGAPLSLSHHWCKTISQTRQADIPNLLSAVRVNFLSALLESPNLFFSSDMSDIFLAVLFPVHAT